MKNEMEAKGYACGYVREKRENGGEGHLETI